MHMTIYSWGRGKDMRKQEFKRVLIHDMNDYEEVASSNYFAL
jgi:hypothetical protein